MESTATTASPAASMSTSLPLAKARLRLGRLGGRGKTRGRPKGTSRLRAAKLSSVIALRASGQTNREIADTVGLCPQTVGQWLQEPASQAELSKRRDVVKTMTMERLGTVVGPAWDLTQKAIQAEDAKAFDNATRGLYALEKISSSASGDATRVQVQHTGQINVDHREELRALLAVIVSPGHPQ